MSACQSDIGMVRKHIETTQSPFIVIAFDLETDSLTKYAYPVFR